MIKPKASRRSLFIVVTGHPGTGKTTLSQAIARQFNLPCLNKDEVKERLADELGCETREESKRLGRATYTLLDYFIEVLMRGGGPFVVESNFPAQFYSEKLSRLTEQYHYRVFQILCKADPETLMERVNSRIELGERHSAHKDRGEIESGQFRKNLGDGRIIPLGLGGTLYELDTTDFSAIDYGDVFKALGSALEEGTQ